MMIATIATSPEIPITMDLWFLMKFMFSALSGLFTFQNVCMVKDYMVLSEIANHSEPCSLSGQVMVTRFRHVHGDDP